MKIDNTSGRIFLAGTVFLTAAFLLYELITFSSASEETISVCYILLKALICAGGIMFLTGFIGWQVRRQKPGKQKKQGK